MPFIGNKCSGAIFGTFVCRFHVSPALSEQNVPLTKVALIIKIDGKITVCDPVANSHLCMLLGRINS